MEVTLSRTAPLYAGTSLTLTCTVTLDPNVDNDVSVMTQWSHKPKDRYTVTDARGNDSTYTGNLTISPLADQDDGTYTCTVTVTGRSNVQQATASDEEILNILGKTIIYVFHSVSIFSHSSPPRSSSGDIRRL